MSEAPIEKIFQCLTSFVEDLGESFATDNHPLALYERLITKTKLVHKEAVEKHVSAFRTFYNANKANIAESKPEFTENIVYSAKVYIDMNAIFRLEMDADTRKAIWNHLHVIATLYDPTLPKLAIVPSQTVPLIDGDSEEDKFLNKVISRVQTHVTDDTTDPQAAISNILSSDLIPELVGTINSGMSNGTFNIGKMMSSVEKMVTGMGGGDPQAGEAMSMLRGLMGNMKM